MRRRIKTYIILGLLLAAVLGIFGCGSKEESYRVIKVLTLEGTAKVIREGIGELDAYVDMRLQSGDALSVPADSNMVLNLDDDKYVLLESGTEVKLVAEGTSTDSRTVLHLTEGAVVNQLTNKLNDNSSYEVTVPNSTMAVRGTVFRVAIEYDEDGDSYAVVTVLEGKVGSRLIFPDGTIQTLEEEREIPRGMQVQVHGDSVISEYYPYDLQEVDLERYSIEALEFLKLCLDQGAELFVTEEEIDAWIEWLTNDETSAEEEPVEEEEEMEETEEEEPEEEPVVTAPAADPEPVPEEPAPAAPAEDSGSESSSSSSSSSESTTTPTYTVTFTYNNSTFCTQTLQEGATATEPKLWPATSGSWSFDFTTPITADTTIRWVE